MKIFHYVPISLNSTNALHSNSFFMRVWFQQSVISKRILDLKNTVGKLSKTCRLLSAVIPNLYVAGKTTVPWKMF
jgi:hypothetical protein